MRYLKTKQREAFSQEMNDLKEQQHDAIKKAIYFRMTPDEVRQFEIRRERIQQLLEILQLKPATAAETRPPLILLQMNHPDVRNARKLTKVYWWTRLYQLSIFQSEEIHRGEADGNGVIRVIPPHIAKLRVCI